ncbi:MAG: SPOR domain-containing protein [Desulfobacteraceae bacterium]|nr:SPOR domain-containing protein [Desulfobacteraceae bacterium]
MARKAPKENVLVRIELGIGGILGLAVIAFCVFLWMYLFGVWTGQSGLQSTLSTDPRELMGAAAKLLKNGPPSPSPARPEVAESAPSAHQTANATPAKTPDESARQKDDNGPSFFAIQVGAFREEQRALKAVAQWRARSYDAFYLQPDADGNLCRVMVGHFDSLAAANDLAAKLEASEQSKVFISLVAESQKRYPAP